MLVNLNEILSDARKRNYGVGLFNTTDTDMLEAVLSAAEELRAPVIIGTAEVLLPAGELKLIAPSILAAAKRATVPVVVHYDHGLTFERCMEALGLGFSSVMFDGSAGDYEKNIADTREIVRIAHAFGATVEGEIGHVGEANANDNVATDLYTKVEEAKDYAERTGVDALAIAFGTAHGIYKTKPVLNMDIITKVREYTDLPLVMHGGSGVSEEGFKKSIESGIRKINYYSYMSKAGYLAAKEVIESGKTNYLHDVEYAAMQAMKDDVKKAISIFSK